MKRAARLRTALALALLPGSALPAAARVELSAFRAPEGEQVLTRTLRRSLGDGNEIVTTRRYSIRFIPDAIGWRVEGRQIGAEVAAPAKLAPLAALERQRVDEGMFPVLLDRQGLIVEDQRPGGTREPADPGVRTALRKVEAMIAASALAADEQGQAATMARALAGRTTQWPEDLFRPAGNSIRTRNYILPDGNPGSVTITITASAAGRLLRRFERTTTTAAAGEKQVNVEIFTLERAAG